MFLPLRARSVLAIAVVRTPAAAVVMSVAVDVVAVGIDAMTVSVIPRSSPGMMRVLVTPKVEAMTVIVTMAVGIGATIGIVVMSIPRFGSSGNEERGEGDGNEGE